MHGSWRGLATDRLHEESTTDEAKQIDVLGDKTTTDKFCVAIRCTAAAATQQNCQDTAINTDLTLPLSIPRTVEFDRL